MKLEEKYFSQEASPKDILDYFAINYFKARETHLDEGEHQYLMDTLLLIQEERKKLDSVIRKLGLWEKETMWKSLAFNETMLFSALDYPWSIRALSLYAAYKRFPIQSYLIEENYDMIMTPIVKMYEAGSVLDVYKGKNPKVMKGMSEIEYLFPNIEESKQIGLELMHSEARNMIFYKRLDEYLREEESRKLAGGGSSLFTWTNLNNKIRCFCKKIDRARKALEQYQKDGDIKRFIANSGMVDLTRVHQNYVLETFALEKARFGVPGVKLATSGNWNETGKEDAIKDIARRITLNADLLY
jgi:hypothetical protein